MNIRYHRVVFSIVLVLISALALGAGAAEPGFDLNLGQRGPTSTVNGFRGAQEVGAVDDNSPEAAAEALAADPERLILLNDNLADHRTTDDTLDPVDCVCGGLYQTGDRVIAVEDIGNGILTGHTGTVICGNNPGNPPVLVSWDNWQDGHDGSLACDCPVTSLSDTSGWFVYCEAIEFAPPEEVDCACAGLYTTGDRVITTVDDPSNSNGLPAGTQGTVICGFNSTTILISWDGWQAGHDGNGLCACPETFLNDDSGWYVQCSVLEFAGEAGCVCAGAYQPGDRVVAVVDHPGSNVEIMAGHVGTVICGNNPGNPPLLVSWDAWQNGHDGGTSCDCPTATLADTSGWFVYCTDVEPASDAVLDCVCYGTLSVGNRVEAAVYNPSGAPNILAGHRGTVICGNNPGQPPVLVSWDGWDEGGDGALQCDCSNTLLPGNSGWFVHCDEFNVISGEPARTMAVTMDATPASGQLPFATTFTTELINPTSQVRRAAAAINVTLANGTFISSWRAGYTNLSPHEIVTTAWLQSFPNLAAVTGSNIFTLLGADVTPPPYNQPPYAPSGETDTDSVTVVGN